MISAGLFHVIVGVAFPTNKVPLPVELSPGTAGLAACTVNVVEPAGVAAVVLIVSVVDFEVSPDAKLRLLEVKEAVAPAGRDVVRLRFAVKAVPVAPLRFTVTV